MSDIAARAREMSDAQREAYLLTRGWQWVGVGYIAPGAVERWDGDMFILRDKSGGLFSRTTAVLEQLARDDPTGYHQPNEHGRYYRA
jgi:hypothetical protein